MKEILETINSRSIYIRLPNGILASISERELKNIQSDMIKYSIPNDNATIQIESEISLIIQFKEFKIDYTKHYA